MYAGIVESHLTILQDRRWLSGGLASPACPTLDCPRDCHVLEKGARPVISFENKRESGIPRGSTVIPSLLFRSIPVLTANQT